MLGGGLWSYGGELWVWGHGEGDYARPRIYFIYQNITNSRYRRLNSHWKNIWYVSCGWDRRHGNRSFSKNGFILFRINSEFVGIGSSYVPQKRNGGGYTG